MGLIWDNIAIAHIRRLKSVVLVGRIALNTTSVFWENEYCIIQRLVVIFMVVIVFGGICPVRNALGGTTYEGIKTSKRFVVVGRIALNTTQLRFSTT